MHTNVRVGPEIFDPVSHDETLIGIRRLKIFGGINSIFGLICVILGVVEALLSRETDMNCYNTYNTPYTLYERNNCQESVVDLIFGSVCAFLSVWFILTGSFPFFMIPHRYAYWNCLKITFLVFSILSAAVFGPTVFSLGLVMALINKNYHKTTSLGVTAALSIVAFLEAFVSLIAASYCCCCSKLQKSNSIVSVAIDPTREGMSSNQEPAQQGMTTQNVENCQMTNNNQISLQQRLSRIRALKLIGGIHIGLGVVCVGLSLAGAIMSSGNVNKGCFADYSYYTYTYYDYYQSCSTKSSMFAISISTMALSGWFILTGCIPFCMTTGREPKWQCLKIAFLVLNIIGSVLFATTVCALGIVGSIIKGNQESVVAVMACLAVFSFIEFIMTIVAASFCCCCSQLTKSRETVVTIAMHTGVMYNMQQTQIQTGNPNRNVPVWPTNVYQMGHQAGYGHPWYTEHQHQPSAQNWNNLYHAVMHPHINQENGRLGDRPSTEISSVTPNNPVVHSHNIQENGRVVDRPSTEISCVTPNNPVVHPHNIQENGRVVDRPSTEISSVTPNNNPVVHPHNIQENGRVVDQLSTGHFISHTK